MDRLSLSLTWPQAVEFISSPSRDVDKVFAYCKGCTRATFELEDGILELPLYGG